MGPAINGVVPLEERGQRLYTDDTLSLNIIKCDQMKRNV